MHKLGIHQSEWYGITIQSSILKTSPSSDARLETHRAATLLFSLFIKSNGDNNRTPKLSLEVPEANQICSRRCFRHQELVFQLPRHRAKHGRSDQLNLNNGKRGPLTRRVFDSHLMNFEVETTVDFQHDIFKGRAVHEMVETEASGYTIDAHSIKLKHCERLESCDAPWSHLDNMTSKEWGFSTNTCATSGSYHDQSAVVECYRSFHIYPLPLSSADNNNRGIIIRYRAKKNLPHVDAMPPDASYGLDIFPMLIGLSVSQSRVKYLSSPSMLITRPIPDRTMPYNVVTMVSQRFVSIVQEVHLCSFQVFTLFSFILGSMINMILRRWRLKQVSHPTVS